MKTFRNILMLFVVVAVVFCAQVTFAQEKPVIITHDEKSIQDPVTKQITYLVEVLIPDGSTQPFAGINTEQVDGNWRTIDLKDEDGNGYAELRFTTYNKIDGVQFYYWDRVEQTKQQEGKKNVLGNPFMNKKRCDYYDKKAANFVLMPVDGKVYHMGEVSLPEPPGTGDHMNRVVDKGEYIELYSYYGVVNAASFVSAFVMLEAAGFNEEKQEWNEVPQVIIDANAWAMTTVAKKDINANNKNGDLRLGYGVKTASGQRVFPDPTKSTFHVENGITIPNDKFK